MFGNICLYLAIGMAYNIWLLSTLEKILEDLYGDKKDNGIAIVVKYAAIMMIALGWPIFMSIRVVKALFG